jgi:exopolysaccharide biosynthesis polyprenyl glycosylphosphotransferase
MLKRSSRFQTQLAMLADVVLVCLAMVPALAIHKLLWKWQPDVFAGQFDFFWDQAWLFVLIVFAWMLVFDFAGLYDEALDMGRRRALAKTAQSSLVSLAVLLGLLYVLKLHNFPRTLLLLHTFFSGIAVSLRIIYLQPLFLRVQHRRRLVLAGHPGDVPAVLGWLRAPANAAHFELVGLLHPAGTQPPPGVPSLGTDDRFSETLHSTVVDDVALLPAHLPADRVSAWLKQCQEEGIETLVLASHLKPTIARLELEEIGETPVLLYTTAVRSTWALAVKRLGDILLSAAALLLLSPLFLVFAILIKRTSPGPVFFAQRRCTWHGRIFPMYKFRTMVANAEEIRDKLQAQNEVTGPVFKMKNDPRVTPIGRFLRKYSLDELPQLWNVLRGDMSIVGPRPPIPAEVAQYENWQRRRLSMRGGCTCLWQIGSRNAMEFEDWMRLDLKYIDTWSLSLDLKIIAKTFGVVFRGTGY